MTREWVYSLEINVRGRSTAYSYVALVISSAESRLIYALSHGLCRKEYILWYILCIGWAIGLDLERR